MIARLRGRVLSRDGATVVVDVHGVGYLVHVPAGTTVPPRGQEVELSTSLQVREDSMTLYGFADDATRRLFELLMTASGIGPKVALAILSTHPATTVRRAVVDGDLDTLVAVPGIGRKSAQKLVLELRGKLGGVDDAGDLVAADGGGDAAARGPVAETREALASLGYAPAEVAAAMSAIDLDGDTQALLRRALAELAP